MEGTSTTTTSAANRPWVERYRPKNLDQVSHQTEVVSTLKNAVETGRLPHLLFYGPPGSGKTSVALALCRQLWAPDQWRKRVLELNASDERGISVVRDKIKHFASLSVGNNTGSSASKKQKKFFKSSKNDASMEDDDGDAQEAQYPNPPYKIIILDEADTVTPDAQAALRRIIEAYSKITRFVLICNYVTRIIEPLASRCAKFRFQALPPESMKERLVQISQAEGCPNAPIDAILQVAQGDMRRAVTTLQSVHSLVSGGTEEDSTPQETTITDQDICEIAGLPPDAIVRDLQSALEQPSFDKMKAAVDHVLAEGYSASSLLSALLPRITHSSAFTDLYKADVTMKMAEAEFAMTQGADEALQLLTVGSTAVQCYGKSQRAQASH